MIVIRKIDLRLHAFNYFKNEENYIKNHKNNGINKHTASRRC